jgi:hypothetical protein
MSPNPNAQGVLDAIATGPSSWPARHSRSKPAMMPAGPICPTLWPETTTEDWGRPAGRAGAPRGCPVAGAAVDIQAHRCRSYIDHLM